MEDSKALEEAKKQQEAADALAKQKELEEDELKKQLAEQALEEAKKQQENVDSKETETTTEVTQDETLVGMIGFITGDVKVIRLDECI